MKIEVQLNDQELWGVAEFFKRIGYEDIRRFSKDDEEAQSAFSAIEKIRSELAKRGVDPR